MKDGGPELVPVPSPAARRSFWDARRRRPAFLVFLLAGLVAFLIWLPSVTRASLWSAVRAQRGLLFLLFLFALVTLSLIWKAGQRLDSRVFTLINTQVYPKWLDRFMWLATQPGHMLVAFFAAIVYFLLGRRGLAAEIVLGTLTLWLLVEVIKMLSSRARPYLTLDGTRVVGVREMGNSFPSGHTSQIFFLVTLFVHHIQPGTAGIAALYAVAVLVGITRIYVGAHYPRDVIAGVVLGSVWGLLAAMVDRYWLLLVF
ncbi:MAG: phosphatase PAP2 family protein [Anaerolineae bacterium]|nr:MAG: phosphatase PAP2 family protein [Anaerolineae bacterium]